MRIAEIYASVQGEGLRSGRPSVFVRTSGCNLRCWFCDTPYTSWRPEGDDLSVEEVLDQVLALPEPDVVLTGGEPMLFAELVPLTEALRTAGRFITIETAGTLHLPVACDLMSLSPKLPGSGPERSTAADRPPTAGWVRRHEFTRHRPKVIRRLLAEYDHQVKFVIDRPEDLPAVLAYRAEFPELAADRVHLMPQGIDPAELAARAAWIEPFCRDHGFRFCPRLQIAWFGARRGV
jgi:7-carboxy-7-deazaguanine synthase